MSDIYIYYIYIDISLPPFAIIYPKNQPNVGEDTVRPMFQKPIFVFTFF